MKIADAENARSKQQHRELDQQHNLINTIIIIIIIITTITAMQEKTVHCPT